jgi:hypothetical protein
MSYPGSYRTHNQAQQGYPLPPPNATKYQDSSRQYSPPQYPPPPTQQ